MILPTTNFQDSKLKVKIIAAGLIAGVAKRKVMAGPKPAPLFLMAANKGIIEQEQTESRGPPKAAIR